MSFSLVSMSPLGAESNSINLAAKAFLNVNVVKHKAELRKTLQ